MKKCDRCGNKEATIILTDVWQERLCYCCLNEVVSDEGTRGQVPRPTESVQASKIYYTLKK
ncbi:DUF7685 domain-containing protein [Pseudalkalibacillus sp. NRS-1564]|uniref:DUF7685 domain-containing protein n=1 Tax=Pseudalkalibacillus sp. NRS-1564 TaxID=3233900 RepID=UPI003D29557D